MEVRWRGTQRRISEYYCDIGAGTPTLTELLCREVSGVVHSGMGFATAIPALRRCSESESVRRKSWSTKSMAVQRGSLSVSRWQCWKLRNSTLWRISSTFWLLNAAVNAVTAIIAGTPSVYLALGGFNVILAGMSGVVSFHYRTVERSMSSADSKHSPKKRLTSEVVVE